MHCPHCGAQVLPDSTFCNSCGKAIAARRGGSGGLKVVIIVVVLGVGLLVLVAVIGIVAAIAIPSLLRAKLAANEAAAKGDIRSMISAEMAYSLENGGFYDRPECLVNPAKCRPGGSQMQMLDPAVALATEKSGYRRTFHPGPPADPGAIARANASPSSVTAFAYVAVPIKVNNTGIRAFCGDSTGRLCAMADGSEPVVEDGQCSLSCPTLP